MTADAKLPVALLAAEAPPRPLRTNYPAPFAWLCCKDDRRRWEDGDKLDPISFMRRYRKER
jgi:hypothetical protein